MSNPVSLAAMQAILARETGEAFLECLTLSHASWGAPIRLVNDKVDLVRAAGTFLAFAFSVSLPDQAEDRPPQVQLEVDNVDQTVLDAIRGLPDPPAVTFEIVRADDPDDVVEGPYAFTLSGMTYNASSVRSNIGYEDILNEPFPEGTFTPQDFPGLF